MTNGDYFRQTISDKEISELIANDNLMYTCTSRVYKAFEQWCKESGSVDTNIKQGNPSPFYWQRVYNEDTHKWESSCRTLCVSIQDFLHQKYKEEYWTQQKGGY